VYIRESCQQLKRVDLVVSDRMLYIIVRSCWCDIIVLNVHVPTKDKIDDIKDSFCEELVCAFSNFLKYHMKILLGDFIAKVGRQDIFKQTKIRVVNFATSENLFVRRTIFPIFINYLDIS
jgi:hypothetical protein